MRPGCDSQDTTGAVTQTTQLVPVFPPTIPPTFIPVTSDSAQLTWTDETSRQFEGQYQYQQPDYNIVTGANYAEVDQEFTEVQSLAFTPPTTVLGPGVTNVFSKL